MSPALIGGVHEGSSHEGISFPPALTEEVPDGGLNARMLLTIPKGAYHKLLSKKEVSRAVQSHPDVPDHTRPVRFKNLAGLSWLKAPKILVAASGLKAGGAMRRPGLDERESPQGSGMHG
jgi:hypothetical protein